MDPTSVPKATAASVAMIAISSEVRAPWTRPASRLAAERVGAEQEVAERRRERLGDDGERTAGREQRRCGGEQQR